MQTIYALASARGRAGVAVIRISGAQAHDAVRELCGDIPATRKAVVRKISDGEALIDEGIVLVFDSGASFTGEDVAELHVHGSTAVVSKVLRTLAGLPLLRQAEPGEFTRRALENGRLDLSQVEGLADLIESETEAQRQQAMRVFRGAIATQVTQWREELLHGMALLEATIDFSDEDLPDDLLQDAATSLETVRLALVRHIAGYGAAERVRDGFEVALVGAPNVGKSTLLNAIARRDAALTSPIAGTTRDVIEVRMDVSGLAVTFLDTAGIRETPDPLESAGIARTLDRASEADLRVFLVEHEDEPLLLERRAGDLVVLSKADVNATKSEMLRVSGVTGAGIDGLLETIAGLLLERSANAGIVVHERHRNAVVVAERHLQSAVEAVRSGVGIEICADELRLGVRALESLVGTVDTEELLGHIFGRFCIGK